MNTNATTDRNIEEAPAPTGREKSRDTRLKWWLRDHNVASLEQFDKLLDRGLSKERLTGIGPALNNHYLKLKRNLTPEALAARLDLQVMIQTEEPRPDILTSPGAPLPQAPAPAPDVDTAPEGAPMPAPLILPENPTGVTATDPRPETQSPGLDVPTPDRG